MVPVLNNYTATAQCSPLYGEGIRIHKACQLCAKTNKSTGGFRNPKAGYILRDSFTRLRIAVENASVVIF